VVKTLTEVVALTLCSHCGGLGRPQTARTDCKDRATKSKISHWFAWKCLTPRLHPPLANNLSECFASSLSHSQLMKYLSSVVNRINI